MKCSLVKFLIPLACAGFIANAHADVSASSTQNDPVFNGETFQSVISFAENEVISDLSVTFNIFHTRVGDLTATLAHAGQTITLMSPSNDNSNLGALGIPPYRAYTFSDSGTTTIEAEAASLNGTNTFLPSSPGTEYLAASETFAANFSGQNTAGDWTLSITDSTSGRARNSFGAINGWSIQIASAVPEPAPLAFLAAGGIMLLARKRRGAQAR